MNITLTNDVKSRMNEMTSRDFTSLLGVYRKLEKRQSGTETGPSTLLRSKVGQRRQTARQVRSFVRLSIRPFVRPSIRSFVRLFVRSFVRPSVHSFVRSFDRSFVRSCILFFTTRSFHFNPRRANLTQLYYIIILYIRIPLLVVMTLQTCVGDRAKGRLIWSAFTLVCILI